MTVDKATVKQARSFSGIWAIPVIALVLGLYMVAQTWLTQGPEITIVFDTASGLQQGKTKVKYRNVDMGLVEKVSLNDDLKGIVATVKLDRQAAGLLRKDTRFWVVTARIGVGNISGLDTLLSGAYIQLSPGIGEAGKRKFVGLEKPPVTPAEAPGLRLTLTNDLASSISEGDTVLYKGYKVGRVENMTFDTTKRKIVYEIFIDAPYHELVTTSVRFWDVSGVSLSADASGFRIETGSLDTILFGGVAFAIPPGIKDGAEVEQQSEFKLYSSYRDILDNPYKYGTYYVVSFAQSIKGLEPGAPVEYRGIQVGRVERVLLQEFLEQTSFNDDQGMGEPIPILIYVEPGRMKFPDRESSIATMRRSIQVGVSNGMRATLGSGNLLTGAKYVGIDYYADAEKASMGEFLGYTTIPAIDTGLAQLEQKINSILDTINALPLKDTVAGANAAIAKLNQSLASVNVLLESQSTKGLPDQLNRTLQELNNALRGLSPDSEAYQSINSSLLRLSRTLGNLDSLTRTLSEQPSALILPTEAVTDPIPEVTQ